MAFPATTPTGMMGYGMVSNFFLVVFIFVFSVLNYSYNFSNFVVAFLSFKKKTI